MKTEMASTTTTTTTISQQDSTSSKRHFHWSNKVATEHNNNNPSPSLQKSSSSHHNPNTIEIKKQQQQQEKEKHQDQDQQKTKKQILRNKLRSVILLKTLFNKVKLNSNNNESSSSSSSSRLGNSRKVVGTLFGSRKGHVHFALQRDPNSQPSFLIELSTPISSLVKEMASGLVRIALECDHHKNNNNDTSKRSVLLEEKVWRTFCNGKKCGFATRRDCGQSDWNILKAVEPISMGAGVLPSDKDNDNDNDDDEIMYMRAKFERIVGSRDSEAFYMMNPDSNGAPELSIYLLRV